MKINIVESRYTEIEVDDKFNRLNPSNPNWKDDDDLYNEFIAELKKHGYKMHWDDEIEESNLAIEKIYTNDFRDPIAEW